MHSGAAHCPPGPTQCQLPRSDASVRDADPAFRGVHDRSYDPRGSDAIAQARGEGVSPLRVAGILPAIRGRDALDTKEQGQDALATRPRNNGHAPLPGRWIDSSRFMIYHFHSQMINRK